MPTSMDAGPNEITTGSRLTFREDDDSYKRRLNSMIQIAYVYNTAVTILVVAGLFYLLELNMVMGILLGIILALFTSFPLVMFQVTKASRWEIYRNRFIMPRGISGEKRVIMFKDIEDIALGRDLTGEKVVVHMNSGKKIGIDVKGQRKPLSVLIETFEQYKSARSKRGFEISMDYFTQQPE